MNEFFSNRYVQLGLLTLFIAAVIYTLLFIIFMLIGLDSFPQVIRIMVSVLGAALLVYKFFSQRLSE